ncbi:DUF6509 family protein [Paenibacillus xerothermodurans]|uniref:Pullulanase n=1 Tax=Paenibacillus xerothermodurans TaxID=1977292 RepID=A0A2W1NP35_PAEXE|nr:DUF6509 family protein [Paenibacillus xerothermodurans]PZE20673.1 pullulanase [Paenibacillus xerothermodurans]
MLTITSFSAQLIKDPFGILPGYRYEFLLDIAVPEDDELYSEQGLYIRAIYRVEPERAGLMKYEIFERDTQKYLEYDLEDDEVAAVEAFCKEHLAEAE